jgi:hypothetical protein
MKIKIMKQSNFLSLNGNDFLKGLLMAALVPVFTILTESLNVGVLTFNWKAIGIAAVAGGVGYLTKNLFTAPKKEE